MIPHSRAEGCLGALRADLAAISRVGGYNFPFCAEKDTPFPLRRVPRSIPGGFGGIFLRRRLQFSIPRGQRYPIPAQKGTTEDSGRIWHRFPAHAATIFHSARKKIPHSSAERCHGAIRAGKRADSRAEGCPGAFRADLAAISRAGGYNFPFCAEKDTPFPRRTLLRRIPGGKGSPFTRKR